MRRFTGALAALAMAATLASAQARPPGAEGKAGSWYPLGGIDAMGEIVGGGSEITVVEVFEGGFAEQGGLKVGDVIVGAGRRKFKGEGDAIIAELEKTIEDAEAKKPPYGKEHRFAALRIRRADESEKIEVPVRYFGKHTSPYPYECDKCRVILHEALEFLKAEQTEGGKFAKQIANGNHSIAMSSLAGLAWLGDVSGSQDYRDNIAAAADYVLHDAGKDGEIAAAAAADGPNWNQTHWALGYGSIFIGEAFARDPSAEYRQALARWSELLCKQQEPSGGWGHGPGGKNALGYIELEIMSNFALAALGMARRAEVQVDEAKIIKGIEFVKACSSGGGVAYSPDQAGFGDPGRTAGAWWAFRLVQAREKKLMSSMASYWQRGVPDLFEGHACPTMHVLSGALASAMNGERCLAKFWKTFTPFMMASRIHGGAFDTRPSKESRELGRGPSDKIWGTAFITASYAIAMQAGAGTYRLIDSAK